jgi:bacterioferritin
MRGAPRASGIAGFGVAPCSLAGSRSGAPGEREQASKEDAFFDSFFDLIAFPGGSMARPAAAPPAEKKASADGAPSITREQLINLLNEDLAREYQAIIAYLVYWQVLKGAQYMSIADQLETHAKQELDHALIISRQIDYLGGMPTVNPKPVRTSESAEEMLQFDLDNENQTIRNYRERVRQCEALGEYAMAEHIREILVQEQDHQIDLATALGKDVPDVTSHEERA